MTRPILSLIIFISQVDDWLTTSREVFNKLDERFSAINKEIFEKQRQLRYAKNIQRIKELEAQKKEITFNADGSVKLNKVKKTVFQFFKILFSIINLLYFSITGKRVI